MMAHETNGDFQKGDAAPWHSIGPKQIVSVEHPCLIKNLDKGLQTLGGFSELDQMVKQRGENPISLFLNPLDLASHPLISTNRKTDNLLLKITVPKQTGRKRKRGSDEPWSVDSLMRPAHMSVQRVLQSLRDNQETSTVEAVGNIVASQAFRTMPDFVYSTSDSTFMNQMREKILPFKYPLMKEWKLDMSRGKTNTEILPPPMLSTQQIPGKYGYRQNPAVQVAFDPSTGKLIMINAQRARPIYTIPVNCEAAEMPTQPHPSAPPLHTLDEDFRRMVTDLENVFSKRPIWTRRGMFNQLNPKAPILIARQAVSYVAYTLRSGPWRDCYVKLGVDPTSDSQYRIYQSIMLQLTTRSKAKRDHRAPFQGNGKDRPDQTSHIFNGHPPIYDDSKAWQLCDLTDPLLKKLVQTPNLRSQCERRYFGWYKNGTFSKIKIIFKAKMDMIIAGEQPDDSAFENFLRFPEEVQSNEQQQDPMTHLPENAGRQELAWATSYRAMCRALEGSVPASGRLTRSKPAMRAGFLRPLEADYAEDDDGSNDQEETVRGVEEAGTPRDNLPQNVPGLDSDGEGDSDDNVDFDVEEVDDSAAYIDVAREDDDVEDIEYGSETGIEELEDEMGNSGGESDVSDNEIGDGSAQ